MQCPGISLLFVVAHLGLWIQKISPKFEFDGIIYAFHQIPRLLAVRARGHHPVTLDMSLPARIAGRVVWVAWHREFLHHYGANMSGEAVVGLYLLSVLPRILLWRGKRSRLYKPLTVTTAPSSKRQDNDQETRRVELAQAESTSCQSFGGLRGPSLVRMVTLTGAVGFLLFG